MHNRILTCAILGLAACATPALADLTVDAALGSLGSGNYSLSGTTAGQPNQAFTYLNVNNTSTSVWGNGEWVYSFTLAKPSYLSMVNTVEPEADGTFPDPNNDYFLLDSLTTVGANNTSTTTNAAFGTWAGKPEGSGRALVQNSVDATSSGSSPNIGVFRYTGTQVATNLSGVWPAGTYYLSVDSNSGSITTYGQPNQLPAGQFAGTFRVKAVDEVKAPAHVPGQISTGSQVSGPYNAGDVIWTSFAYTAGTTASFDTNGNTLGGGDTVLALFGPNGEFIKVADDNPTGLGLWSQIDIAGSEGLASGTYYLALTQYKMVANQGFDVSTFAGSSPNSGTWLINGLTAVPEPTAMALLTAIPAAALRRRRKATPSGC